LQYYQSKGPGASAEALSRPGIPSPVFDIDFVVDFVNGKEPFFRKKWLFF